MRAITASAARNSRSKTSVSVTLAAVATHATGTPSRSTATWYFVPRLARLVGLGPSGIGTREIPGALGAHGATVQDQVGMAPQHADQHGLPLCRQAHPGPASEPPPQGRAARLSRCRGQGAPRRALANSAAISDPLISAREQCFKASPGGSRHDADAPIDVGDRAGEPAGKRRGQERGREADIVNVDQFADRRALDGLVQEKVKVL